MRATAFPMTVCLTVALLLSSEPTQAQPHYDLFDLGALTGGNGSGAHAINDAGQVVGMWGGSTFDAFLYTPGVGVSNLSDAYTPRGYLTAIDINNSGQVLGESDHGTFVYGAGGPGPRIYPIGTSLALNDAGQVAGVNNVRSFLHTPGSGTQTLPKGFLAYDINNAGQLAGRAVLPTHGSLIYTVAAVYSDQGEQRLGTLGTGLGSTAYALNDAGVVVGESDIGDRPFGDHTHAFMYTPATGMVDLHTLSLPHAYSGSSAATVNALGQIGGHFWNSPFEASSAFIYESAYGMLDVNTLIDTSLAAHWHLASIGQLNNRGQAIGHGFLDGAPRAFVLSLATPVPEPQVWALLALGLPLLCWRMRQARRAE